MKPLPALRSFKANFRYKPIFQTISTAAVSTALTMVQVDGCTDPLSPFFQKEQLYKRHTSFRFTLIFSS